jgi:hypothetical protein
MAQFGTKRRTVRAPFSAGIAVSGRIAKMKYEFAEVMRRVLFDRTELITWELCWVVFEIRGHTGDARCSAQHSRLSVIRAIVESAD